MEKSREASAFCKAFSARKAGAGESPYPATYKFDYNHSSKNRKNGVKL